MPYAEINGQGVHYVDTGGDGLPIVALHGFMLDGRQFDGLPGRRGARWICPDLRGAGRTRWDGRPFTFADMVADTTALIDALGIERPVLVATGLGATVAVAVAAERDPAGLMLIAPRADGCDALTAAGYGIMLESWAEEGPAAFMVDALADAWFGTRTPEPSLGERWLSTWKSVPRAALAAQIAAFRDRPDLVPGLSALTCPAVVLRGTWDGVVSREQSEEVAARLSGAGAVVEVPQAGHAMTLSHPDAVLGALASLAERIGAPS